MFSIIALYLYFRQILSSLGALKRKPGETARFGTRNMVEFRYVLTLMMRHYFLGGSKKRQYPNVMTSDLHLVATALDPRFRQVFWNCWNFLNNWIYCCKFFEISSAILLISVPIWWPTWKSICWIGQKIAGAHGFIHGNRRMWTSESISAQFLGSVAWFNSSFLSQTVVLRSVFVSILRPTRSNVTRTAEEIVSAYFESPPLDESSSPLQWWNMRKPDFGLMYKVHF